MGTGLGSDTMPNWSPAGLDDRLYPVFDGDVLTPPRVGGARAAGWLGVAYVFLAAGTAALIFVRPVTDRLADLGVYWGAAQAVRTGAPLYGFHATNGDPFTYPPFAMVLFYPLGYLPQMVVGVIWTLATFTAFVALARLLVSRWTVVAPAKGVALVWACAIALLLSAPGQSNVRFGQVSIFIVLVALADAVGAVPQRMRGVLVGAAAAVKLTPLLFIVFYLITGRRRDALRAGASFAICTALAWLVMPQASTQYWTSELFATSRIGDLAALGNQSLNGILLRAGLPAPGRPLVWLLLVVVLVAIALWRARQLDRRGLPVHAAVLVGCATLAASPVSWTHHQFWTALAAMLLVSGVPGLSRAAGWVLLVSMTVNVVDLLAHVPIGDHALFLAANMRGIAVAAVCVMGLAPIKDRLRSRRVAHALQATDSAGHRRGRLPLVLGALTAVALFALMPLPAAADPTFRPASAARALHLVTGGLPPCAPGHAAADCSDIPLFADLKLNYAVSWSVDGHADVQGFASKDVHRLTYQPAPSSEAVSIPLGRLSNGDQAFLFTAGDTTYGQLKAYDQSGNLFAEFGHKLRTD